MINIIEHVNYLFDRLVTYSEITPENRKKMTIFKGENFKTEFEKLNNLKNFTFEPVLHKFLFTGFLNRDEVNKIFSASDIYVLSSVSEPFGIAPLEAMSFGIASIISKQSGVSEIVKNALKVDFWDVKELANKILGVLKYQTLHNEMAHNGKDELKNIRWENAGKKIMDIYHSVV